MPLKIWNLCTNQELLLVLGEDQGDKQNDGEEGDDHQHHVGCRVSSGGCYRWKIHIRPLNGAV